MKRQRSWDREHDAAKALVLPVLLFVLCGFAVPQVAPPSNGRDQENFRISVEVDLVVLQATVEISRIFAFRWTLTWWCCKPPYDCAWASRSFAVSAPRSTGAKGLNLAATDVTVLAAGLVAFYKRN